MSIAVKMYHQIYIFLVHLTWQDIIYSIPQMNVPSTLMDKNIATYSTSQLQSEVKLMNLEIETKQKTPE